MGSKAVQIVQLSYVIPSHPFPGVRKSKMKGCFCSDNEHRGKKISLGKQVCSQRVKGNFSNEVPYSDSPISDVRRTHSS